MGRPPAWLLIISAARSSTASSRISSPFTVAATASGASGVGAAGVPGTGPTVGLGAEAGAGVELGAGVVRRALAMVAEGSVNA